MRKHIFFGPKIKPKIRTLAEEVEEESTDEESDCSPGRNYGKLVIPAIAAVLLAYHLASPYVSKTMASIRGGDKKTEEKGKQSTIETKTIECKDGSVLIFDSSKPGHYKCNDEQKPETPAASDLEKKTNETATTTVSIDEMVSPAAANYVKPSKVGNPYTQENKIVQEVDGVPQAKEIAPNTHRGVMAEGSLQLSPDLKHVAWYTGYTPKNSRGIIYTAYVADVVFDENGEIHVFQESIKAVRTYQGRLGPKVTDISWIDNGALEVVTDNTVRLGRYGIRTNHVEKTEIVPVK